MPQKRGLLLLLLRAGDLCLQNPPIVPRRWQATVCALLRPFAPCSDRWQIADLHAVLPLKQVRKPCFGGEAGGPVVRPDEGPDARLGTFARLQIFNFKGVTRSPRLPGASRVAAPFRS